MVLSAFGIGCKMRGTNVYEIQSNDEDDMVVEDSSTRIGKKKRYAKDVVIQAWTGG